MDPHLYFEMTFYPATEGGPQRAISSGYRIPCCASKTPPRSSQTHAWDGVLIFEGEPIEPGETRRVGVAFLSGDEAARAFEQSGTLFLWEGGFRGEAKLAELDIEPPKFG